VAGVLKIPVAVARPPEEDERSTYYQAPSFSRECPPSPAKPISALSFLYRTVILQSGRRIPVLAECSYDNREGSDIIGGWNG